MKCSQSSLVHVKKQLLPVLLLLIAVVVVVVATLIPTTETAVLIHDTTNGASGRQSNKFQRLLNATERIVDVLEDQWPNQTPLIINAALLEGHIERTLIENPQLERVEKARLMSISQKILSKLNQYHPSLLSNAITIYNVVERTKDSPKVEFLKGIKSFEFPLPLLRRLAETIVLSLPPIGRLLQKHNCTLNLSNQMPGVASSMSTSSSSYFDLVVGHMCARLARENAEQGLFQYMTGRINTNMVFYYQSELVQPPYIMYMGEDKNENELLIRWGWPEDVWFHVDKLSSAHVYLRLREGETIDDVPDVVIQDCLQLVKENSIQGKKQNEVDIVYTMWDNLKKTGSMDVGQVGFHHSSSVRQAKAVKRVNEIVNRLGRTKSHEVNPDLRAKREQRDERQRAKEKSAQASKRKAELIERKRREADAEARSYDRLFTSDKMQTNADGYDSDDFM